MDGECYDCYLGEESLWNYLTAHKEPIPDPPQETLQTFLEDFQDFDMSEQEPDHVPRSFPGTEERSQALDHEILEYNWIYTNIKKIRKGYSCIHGVQFIND